MDVKYRYVYIFSCIMRLPFTALSSLTLHTRPTAFDIHVLQTDRVAQSYRYRFDIDYLTKYRLVPP